jgi:hypothetical protein
MLLICVDKVAESFDVFTEAPGFAVNILAEDQADTSGLFASKRPDKFDITPWTESETGYPILDGVCAWFDCRRHQVIDAGDHVILIGEILGYHSNDGIGLGYVRGGYMSLGMERSAAKASGNGSDVVVGAIIEHAGKILLYTDPKNDQLYVPASGLDGSVGSLQKFQAEIDKLDIGVTISSLFAVYENEETGQQSIYYRATAESEKAGEHFWAFDDIPWQRVQSSAMTVMLKRYVSESSRQRFGIYFGSDKDGAVKTLSE